MLPTKALMDDFYDNHRYRSRLSRADFYALAGISAVEIAIDNNNRDCQDRSHCQFVPKPRFDYLYGREDCPTSPLTNANDSFPPGHNNHTQTMDFFSEAFKLSVSESVALLGGGHTLGGAHANGTGFLGLFKGGEV
jgi:catalase (peroxidase I)